jgi:hypothetical protein
MIKARKNSMSQAEQTKKKSGFTIEPWSCVNRNGAWEIEAYSMLSGRRKTVATVIPNNDFPAEAIAEYIVSAVNIIEKQEALINEMSFTLEMCLESEDGKIDWATEHDAEILIQRANSRARI